MLKSLLTALPLALLASASLAQTTYVSQLPDHGPGATVWFSDLATYDPVWFTTQFLAEDLVVAPGDRLVPTKLIWWGADFGATFTGADQFTVELRQDDGFGNPGIVLHTHSGPQPTATVTGWQPTGVFNPWVEQRYELTLTGAPVLESGRYFFVVYNDTTLTSDGTWGWSGSSSSDPASEPGFVFSDQAGAIWYPVGSTAPGLAYELEVDLLEPLTADVSSLSVSAGGAQVFTLDAGPSYAGDLYFLAGSLSGTSPGFAYGSVHVPLNVDAYLLYTVTNPNSALLPGSFGFLDGAGSATAFLSTFGGADPALVGLTAAHAFVALDPVTLEPTLASNAVTLDLVP